MMKDISSALNSVKKNISDTVQHKVKGLYQMHYTNDTFDKFNHNLLFSIYRDQVYSNCNHVFEKIYPQKRIVRNSFIEFAKKNLKDWFYIANSHLFLLWNDEHKILIKGFSPFDYTPNTIDFATNTNDVSYINISVLADVEYINIVENSIMDNILVDIDKHIKWFYLDSDKDMVNTDVTLKKRSISNEMYPYLNKSIDDYYNSYLKSESNILVLIGSPGTGKTTFINGLLNLDNVNGAVSYDKDLMVSDHFLNTFISDAYLNVLIFEDADMFLVPRDGGNDIMHKFLSIGDGLVSNKNKKIIFSTNLKSVDDIDKALTRKGRCFDILHFRPLTYKEATNLCEVANIKIKLDPKKSYTLSELFNSEESGTDTVIKSSFGFS